VIDAAKGVALLAANGGRILDYEGIDRIEHPIPPLIMGARRPPDARTSRP
jgi:alcohol dehydrogenase